MPSDQYIFLDIVNAHLENLGGFASLWLKWPLGLQDFNLLPSKPHKITGKRKLSGTSSIFESKWQNHIFSE